MVLLGAIVAALVAFGGPLVYAIRRLRRNPPPTTSTGNRMFWEEDFARWLEGRGRRRRR